MPRRRKKRGKKRSVRAATRRRQETHRQERQDVQTVQGWVRLALTATLLEDAHLGSGSGGGGIDALVARDRDDRPVIWASHLKGLLRDAARRTKGDAGGLFGRGGGQRQRVLLTSLYADTTPASRIWRSTARASFENRAPRDDTLRVVEYVPRGTVFKGAVEVHAADRAPFERLIQEIDAVGRGRATGAGRVRLELSESRPAGRAVGKATERLHLLLRCRDPLCITATATPDNLVPSMSFVPGRTLLGAIAAWLIAEGHRDVAALLTGARLSVGDALPLPEDPMRLAEAEVLPAPLTLQREKPAGAAGELPWWAGPPSMPRRLDMCRRPDDADDVKLKRPEADLFVFRPSKAAPWRAYRPVMRVRLRNGRPVPGQVEPDLFAVEQIAERTAFLCEISGGPMHMKKLAKALAPVLEGRRWLRVGRGGAPVEVERLAWSGASQPPEPAPSRAYFVLTSDLLVRDEYLRWATAMDEQRFCGLPGWPDEVRVTPMAQDAVAVHGFNGTSRLWRLPASAVRRGSVYEVEGEGVAALFDLAASGRWLGERTHEGFGRFRLDAVDSLPGVVLVGSDPDRPVTAPDDDPLEAVAVASLGWFEGHEKLATTAAKDNRGKRPPSLSQWMDLVSALERGDRRALADRLQPTAAGARSWEHVDAKAILEKLQALDISRRALHARMFVHRLRAEMRKNSRRKTA